MSKDAFGNETRVTPKDIGLDAGTPNNAFGDSSSQPRSVMNVGRPKLPFRTPNLPNVRRAIGLSLMLGVAAFGIVDGIDHNEPYFKVKNKVTDVYKDYRCGRNLDKQQSNLLNSFRAYTGHVYVTTAEGMDPATGLLKHLTVESKKTGNRLGDPIQLVCKFDESRDRFIAIDPILAAEKGHDKDAVTSIDRDDVNFIVPPNTEVVRVNDYLHLPEQDGVHQFLGPVDDNGHQHAYAISQGSG